MIEENTYKIPTKTIMTNNVLPNSNCTRFRTYVFCINSEICSPWIFLFLINSFLNSYNSVPVNMITNGYTIKATRSEEHTSELQSRFDLVCRLLLEKKKHRQNRVHPQRSTVRAC